MKTKTDRSSIPGTASWFLKKLLRIPKKKWCVGVFEDDEGRRCVRGHVMKDPAFITSEFPSGRLVDNRLTKLFQRFNSFEIYPAQINNWPTEWFPQKHPRDRVVAALTKLEKMGKEDTRIKKKKARS